MVESGWYAMGLPLEWAELIGGVVGHALLWSMLLIVTFVGRFCDSRRAQQRALLVCLLPAVVLVGWPVWFGLAWDCSAVTILRACAAEAFAVAMFYEMGFLVGVAIMRWQMRRGRSKRRACATR